MRVSDTSAEAQHRYVATYSQLTGEERVKQACEMAELAKSVALDGIRYRNPELGEVEVAAEWIRQLHGDHVYHSIFDSAV